MPDQIFGQTFVDGTGKTNKSWTVTISFLVEIVVILVMILLPLIYTEVLPKAQLDDLLDGATTAATATAASASGGSEDRQGGSASV